MLDLYEYSIPELVKLLGGRFKEYRLRANMTQKEVAEQSGVSIMTIHKFETGQNANIALGTLLMLLKAIEQIESIDTLLPELPESPYLYVKDKKIQRIRHKKQDK